MAPSSFSAVALLTSPSGLQASWRTNPHAFPATVLLSLCLFGAFGEEIVVAQVHPDAETLPLAGRLRAIDLELGIVPLDYNPAPTIETLLGRLSTCAPLRADPDPWAACALETILGEGGLRAAPDPSTTEENLFSGALARGKGTCAALVAVVLALTEPYGEPFVATVLREHVVLSARWKENLHFEVLKGGRPLTEREFRANTQPPGGPETVSGARYVAFYLDNLAARLVEQGRPEEAGRAFVMGLRIAPHSGRLHYNYGTFLLRQGRADEALSHLGQAIRLGWNDAPAWTNRGVASWKLGQIRAARRCFKRALRIDPRSLEAAENLRQLGSDVEVGPRP